MELTKISKYAPLFSIIAGICALLSLFGIQFNIRGYYDSLDIYYKMLILWLSNLIIIIVLFVNLDSKIKNLNVNNFCGFSKKMNYLKRKKQLIQFLPIYG